MPKISRLRRTFLSKIQELRARLSESEKTKDALRRSTETAQRLAQENEVLAQIGRIISSTLKIEEVYERFSRETRKLTHFDRIVVCIVDPGEESFTITYALGLEISVWAMGTSFPMAGSTVERVVHTQRGVIFQPHSSG